MRKDQKPEGDHPEAQHRQKAQKPTENKNDANHNPTGPGGRRHFPDSVSNHETLDELAGYSPACLTNVADGFPHDFTNLVNI